MKREIGARAAAAALAAAVWNIRGADTLTGRSRSIWSCRKRPCSPATPRTRGAAGGGAAHLAGGADYTQIFLRHPELDSTSDAFFETLQELLRRETDAAAGGL